MDERELRGVELVVSDGHKGIQKAVERTFLGASWQMCHVHLERAILEKLPRKYHREVMDKFKEVQEDQTKLLGLMVEWDIPGFEKAAETIEQFQHGLANYQAFPKEHWKRIRTTNMVERLNKEVKRRSKVVGVFPNDESLMRLVVAVLIDQNENWITGNKYLTMKN